MASRRKERQDKLPEQPPPFNQDRMSRSQAAEYIGVSKGTLANWASTGYGDLPFYKPGGVVYYRKSDLDRWLESRKRTQTPF